MGEQTHSERIRGVVGTNIWQLREQAGKTREELAEEADTTRGVIYEFEMKIKSPSLEMLDRLARAFSRLLGEPVNAADLLNPRRDGNGRKRKQPGTRRSA